MKRTTLFSAFAASMLLVALITINSCTKDACKSVPCVQGTTQTVAGVCSCNCNTGFRGAACDTAILFRDAFLSSTYGASYWVAYDTTNGSPTTYHDTISATSSTTTLNVSNFTQSAISNVLNVDSATSRIYQLTTDTFAYSFSGFTIKVFGFSGVLSSSKNTINYSYSQSSVITGGSNPVTDNVTGALVRQ